MVGGSVVVGVDGALAKKGTEFYLKTCPTYIKTYE